MNPEDLNQQSSSSPNHDDVEGKDPSFSSVKLPKRRTTQGRGTEEEDDPTHVAVSEFKRQRLSHDKDSDQRFALNSSSSPCEEEDEEALESPLQLSLGTGKTQTPNQSQTQTESQTQTPSKKSLNLDSYKCDVCGKEFLCYRALGGHKASHKLQSVTGNANADASERTRRKMLPSGKVHKCSICSKIFETGQALGGHKRLHYKGPIGGHKRTQKETVVAGDKSSPSEEEKLKESDQGKDIVVSEGDKWSPGSNGSALTNVSDQEHSVRRLLDLNEPPLPEIDEATGGGDVEEVESAVKLGK